MTSAAALIWALLFGGEGGGGGGEPAAYIKSAVVSDDGKTLTLTKKSGATVSFSVSDLAAAVAGKQDTISDLSTIRTGAGNGATSVQTVNGEEPDASGNVTVTVSEGEHKTAVNHAASANWGDFVEDNLSADGDTLTVTVAEASPMNNRVIRVLVLAAANNTALTITPHGSEMLLWVNGEAPSFEFGHVYEIVISQAQYYLMCSFSDLAPAT